MIPMTSARLTKPRHDLMRTAIGALTLGGSFVSCLIVMATTSTANAWFERTTVYRPMGPNGTGCVAQTSAMNHGAADAPWWIEVQLDLVSMNSTAAGNCAGSLPSDAFYLIQGEISTYLIKQTSDNDTKDGYYLCGGAGTGMLYGSTTFKKKFDFPSAPCGPGWYAIVSCLVNATTVQIPPWIEGHYSATSFSPSQCNVTHHWHPFSVGDGQSMGGAVNL